MDLVLKFVDVDENSLGSEKLELRRQICVNVPGRKGSCYSFTVESIYWVKHNGY